MVSCGFPEQPTLKRVPAAKWQATLFLLVALAKTSASTHPKRDEPPKSKNQALVGVVRSLGRWPVLFRFTKVPIWIPNLGPPGW